MKELSIIILKLILCATIISFILCSVLWLGDRMHEKRHIENIKKEQGKK